MKQVTFDIKNHYERIQIFDILRDNGYEVKIRRATEYDPPKTILVVEVEDSEVEE